ncbi:hypothetical protein RJ641_022688 [Dillenia turbinata]|uniref:Uncharacterized protein n=1 Tax=Dillenia turbinata TaxID=194707 RepID=A0AAN8UMI8_9MAGN
MLKNRKCEIPRPSQPPFLSANGLEGSYQSTSCRLNIIAFQFFQRPKILLAYIVQTSRQEVRNSCKMMFTVLEFWYLKLYVVEKLLTPFRTEVLFYKQQVAPQVIHLDKSNNVYTGAITLPGDNLLLSVSSRVLALKQLLVSPLSGLIVDKLRLKSSTWINAIIGSLNRKEKNADPISLYMPRSLETSSQFLQNQDFYANSYSYNANTYAEREILKYLKLNVVCDGAAKSETDLNAYESILENTFLREINITSINLNILEEKQQQQQQQQQVVCIFYSFYGIRFIMLMGLIS